MITDECTEESCAQMPICKICGQRKKPRGRDGGPVHYCNHECIGYDQEPRAGHLWPGEIERSK